MASDRRDVTEVIILGVFFIDLDCGYGLRLGIAMSLALPPSTRTVATCVCESDAVTRTTEALIGTCLCLSPWGFHCNPGDIRGLPGGNSHIMTW